MLVIQKLSYLLQDVLLQCQIHIVPKVQKN